MKIIAYEPWALPQLCEIWNDVVRQGMAFPQEQELCADGMAAFLEAQSFAAMALEETGEVLGMYILHPNHVGRCGHIANASYAVAKKKRGVGVGHALVRHSLKEAARLGFRGLQYNAVLCSNKAALKTYQDCGFERLARVPGGFRDISGTYQDTFIMFCAL